MERLKISVIIPCYNSEKYICNCIDSLISQTIGMDQLELIFVDDCSTDGTVEILRQYEARFPEQIGIILCEKNGKQGTARNIGLQYACGKYVSFVDSDDWVRRDMYEYLVDIAERTESDIVQFRYTGKQNYREEDEPIDKIEYQTYDIDTIEKRRNMLLRSDILNESCWQKLYRRSLLTESGVQYAEGVSYEEPLFTYPLRFFVKRVTVTPQAFYYYHYNEEGTTAKYMSNPATIMEHLQVQESVFEFVTSLQQAKDFKKEIELYFLHTFFVEPFYFFKYRGLIIPVKLFDWMCVKVKELVPDYRSNIYVDSPEMKDEKMILSLIDQLAEEKDPEEKQKIIMKVQSAI